MEFNPQIGDWIKFRYRSDIYHSGRVVAILPGQTKRCHRYRIEVEIDRKKYHFDTDSWKLAPYRKMPVDHFATQIKNEIARVLELAQTTLRFLVANESVETDPCRDRIFAYRNRVRIVPERFDELKNDEFVERLGWSVIRTGPLPGAADSVDIGPCLMNPKPLHDIVDAVNLLVKTVFELKFRDYTGKPLE